MSRVRVHSFSISLDGFATGEGPSLESPFGHAGDRCGDHGRGQVRPSGLAGGDPEWRCWWGDNPPLHTPTFFLTPRPPPSPRPRGVRSGYGSS